jgi:hypothetical protein
MLLALGVAVFSLGALIGAALACRWRRASCPMRQVVEGGYSVCRRGVWLYRDGEEYVVMCCFGPELERHPWPIAIRRFRECSDG